MLYILIGIVLSIILIAIFFIFSNGEEWYHELSAIFGGVLSLTTIIMIIVYFTMVWEWNASKHKANIINKEYNTSYTQQEIFYASDVIETIKRLNRKQIELNRDLIHK